MVVIAYGNSMSKISGLNPKQMQGLRNLLSYKLDYAKAQYIPNPANRIRYFIDKRGNFESGLLDKVLKYLSKNKIESWIDSASARLKDDYFIYSRHFKSVAMPQPYVDQQNALNRALSLTRGTISMPTGTGKSYVITMLVEKLKLKTLIVVPTLELKSQLYTEMSYYMNSMEGIIIENIDSTALQTTAGYDLLIIDECHRSAAKTYRDLNRKQWSGIRRRYCFSATPFRNQEEEQLLYEGVCGSVIYDLSYKKSVELGYIVPVEAYFYKIPKIQTEAHTYAQVYSELVVKNEVRNLLVADTISTLYRQDKYCLCLVKEVAHGKILSEMTGIPFSHGGDEDSRFWIELFKTGKLKCLIATEGLLGEGVDTRPCEYVILAGLGRAKSSIMQKIGRSVRKYKNKESGKIIFFKDPSHRFLLTSFREHVKILREEYSIVPLELEF